MECINQPVNGLTPWCLIPLRPAHGHCSRICKISITYHYIYIYIIQRWVSYGPMTSIILWILSPSNIIQHPTVIQRYHHPTSNHQWIFPSYLHHHPVVSPAQVAHHLGHEIHLRPAHSVGGPAGLHLWHASRGRHGDPEKRAKNHGLGWMDGKWSIKQIGEHLYKTWQILFESRFLAWNIIDSWGTVQSHAFEMWWLDPKWGWSR